MPSAEHSVHHTLLPCHIPCCVELSPSHTILASLQRLPQVSAEVMLSLANTVLAEGQCVVLACKCECVCASARCLPSACLQLLSFCPIHSFVAWPFMLSEWPFRALQHLGGGAYLEHEGTAMRTAPSPSPSHAPTCAAQASRCATGACAHSDPDSSKHSNRHEPKSCVKLHGPQG